MPWNISRSSQFFDKEVLKYPTPGNAIKSVVLDATTFAQSTDPDARTVVPAGTILKFSVTNSKRYTEYNGTGTIEGILSRPVDLLARSTAANEPAAMFFFNEVFSTNAIVGFTNYASALVSTLTSCKFE
jgi:hypothetical protein